MAGQREPDACHVLWCDESDRPHERHMAYLGSVVASDFVGKALTVQVIAELPNCALPGKPNGAIVLVDSRLMQMGAELTWEQASRVGRMLLEGARRYA